jgi:hypothetical protein
MRFKVKMAVAAVGGERTIAELAVHFGAHPSAGVNRACSSASAIMERRMP